MNLEYVTLGILIVVLLLRWITQRHKSHLRLNLAEASTEHGRLKTEHERLFARRTQQESSLAKLKDERAAADNQLEETRVALETQKQRNEELSE